MTNKKEMNEYLEMVIGWGIILSPCILGLLYLIAVKLSTFFTLTC